MIGATYEKIPSMICYVQRDYPSIAAKLNVRSF